MSTNPNRHTAAFLALPDSYRLITFTGAGGKTSLITWLGTKACPPERRVIITSTTKIFPLRGMCTVLQEDGPDFTGRLMHALKNHSRVVVARRLDPVTGKLIGVSPDMVDALHESRVADHILVEADGAARKPLKAPNRTEPVFPRDTELCIAVMGLDAAYQPLTNDHVHRPELFAKATGMKPGDTIFPEHLIRIAMTPMGLFKGCPPDSDRAVFFNKVDLFGAATVLGRIGTLLDAECPFTDIRWFAGSCRERTAHTILPYETPVPGHEYNRLEISHQF